MGYRSDSIAISRKMGPLSLCYRPFPEGYLRTLRQTGPGSNVCNDFCLQLRASLDTVEALLTWECPNDPWPWYFCKSIAIQMGGVSWYTLVVYIVLSAKRRAYLCKNIAIEMGGVSRYFSKVSGSGVDEILLINLQLKLFHSQWESASNQHLSGL